MHKMLFLALLFLVMPLLTLLPLGGIWLWQNAWMIIWMAVSLVSTVSGAILMAVLRKRQIPAHSMLGVSPDPRWPDSSEAAWRKVIQLRDRTDHEDFAVDDNLRLLQLGQEVVQTVSRHYHPQSSRAELEIPLPYALIIIEMVSRDLRGMLDHIPFSHVMTMHDLKRGYGAIDLAQKSYNIYRAGRWLVNPVEAAVQEVQALLSAQALRYPAENIKTWLLHSYIEKIGYYAIALYSGELTLDDVDVAAAQTPVSSKDRQQAEAANTTPEPLRIVVLGQVNAGKSSLINALFGDLRAAVDTLAHTDAITPYVLQQEGIDQALIFDTAGYQQADGEMAKSMLETICQADLVLLVCSAASAARAADRKYLEMLRAYFRHHPDRRQPPVVIVLTHIDQLRPQREWQPPYNIANPKHNVKARNIRQAVEVVARDLTLFHADVIPVRIDAGYCYNIAEGVIPAVLNQLDTAQHSRYLRCLRQRQKSEYWQQLRKQAHAMGTILLEKGGDLIAGLGNKKSSAKRGADD